MVSWVWCCFCGLGCCLVWVVCGGYWFWVGMFVVLFLSVRTGCYVLRLFDLFVGVLLCVVFVCWIWLLRRWCCGFGFICGFWFDYLVIVAGPGVCCLVMVFVVWFLICGSLASNLGVGCDVGCLCY